MNITKYLFIFIKTKKSDQNNFTTKNMGKVKNYFLTRQFLLQSNKDEEKKTRKILI
jgi:hypothetical protein